MPERAREPEEKPELPEPTEQQRVLFCEPRLVAHPSKSEVRVEQTIRVFGGPDLKHGSVVELPCDGKVMLAAVEQLTGIEADLRSNERFRRSYLKHWPREQRNALADALARLS